MSSFFQSWHFLVLYFQHTLPSNASLVTGNSVLIQSDQSDKIIINPDAVAAGYSSPLPLLKPISMSGCGKSMQQRAWPCQVQREPKVGSLDPVILGYNPKISNLMIFFILTTIVVQLVKFNLATLPFIQAYRRIKFKTITSDDQVVRDKDRNVFLIDSFTGTRLSLWRHNLSLRFCRFLLHIKLTDFDNIKNQSDTIYLWQGALVVYCSLLPGQNESTWFNRSVFVSSPDSSHFAYFKSRSSWLGSWYFTCQSISTCSGWRTKKCAKASLQPVRTSNASQMWSCATRTGSGCWVSFRLNDTI